MDEYDAEIPALIAESLADARPGRVPVSRYSFAPRLPRQTHPDDPPEPSDPPGPDGPHARTAVDEVLPVLRRMRAELGRESVGRIRFPRYRLVGWLLAQSFADEDADRDADRDRVLLQRLRERERSRRDTAGGDLPDLGGTAANLAVRWLRILTPRVWFRLKVTGRLPGPFGAEFAWLRVEAHRARNGPESVLAFAERLCEATAQNRAIQEFHAKLLVGAFLADLRQAYRRRRLRALRRTAYPVALLEGVGERNGGFRFLDLLSDVRNETALFDPLLVIAVSDVVPPRLRGCSLEDPSRPTGIDAPLQSYEDWSGRLANDSRESLSTAWYLSFVISTPLPVPDDVAPGADTLQTRYFLETRNALERARHFTLDPPPLWCRRWFIRVAAVLIAAGVLLGATIPLRISSQDDARWRTAHCGLDRHHPDAATLSMIGNECVGLSENRYPFTDPQGTLVPVEQQIYQQNKDAETQHKKNPSRPYAAIVYLLGLTSSGPPAGSFTSERSELLGVAAAQHAQLGAGTHDGPLTRVILANGGEHVQHGPAVADMLSRRSRESPPVVAVLGLDESRDKTVETIRRLTVTGIPSIGVTLSADRLADASKMYFQVSPQNRREVAVGAAFVKNVLASRAGLAPEVRILYSADPSDDYSSNLAADAEKLFGAPGVGFRIEATEAFAPDSWTSAEHVDAPSADDVGRQACGFPGVIFYAGRNIDFETVLHSINLHCQSAPPVIIGNDAISRYVAETTKRREFPAVPYYYLSFSADKEPCEPESALYAELRGIFPDECGPNNDSFLDGSTSLAYDSVQTVEGALRNIAASQVPIGPAAVWRELSDIHGANAIDGESGLIDFGGRLEQQTPTDKFIAVMEVVGGGLPQSRASCGRRHGWRADAWCPVGD